MRDQVRATGSKVTGRKNKSPARGKVSRAAKPSNALVKQGDIAPTLTTDGIQNFVVEQATKNGYVETILHRRRKILNLESPNPGKKAQAKRLAVNTVIQGSAADLIKVAMVNIQRKIEAENLPVKMILQVHDELVFELPTAEAERHAKWIAEEMTGAIKLDVPLKVDVTFGPSWLAEK